MLLCKVDITIPVPQGTNGNGKKYNIFKINKSIKIIPVSWGLVRTKRDHKNKAPGTQ